jgi:hypothetical protein
MPWSGAPVIYASGPPLAQRNNKRGQAGGTGTNVRRAHSAPQILATKTDQEGAEARGLAHLATNSRPSTHDSDCHRRHVVLLFGSRYTHVIPRL